MTRIQSPSRLHFGLLSLPQAGVTHWSRWDGQVGLPVRSFGGIGLMLASPCVDLEVKRATDWHAEGPLAERALAFAQMDPDSNHGEHVHIQVRTCPPDHSGFGVGTALGLSVLCALRQELGLSQQPAWQLAPRIQRGERSAIGVHGFDHGGFLVEAGKGPGELISPLIARHPFPEDWRIVLLRPAQTIRWHGEQERSAFQQLQQSGNPAAIETLCRVLVQGILPALVQQDLATFGEALHEWNIRVGMGFASVQGGAFASPQIGQWVDYLRGLGISGVGQSSWGPTLFALVADEEQAQWLMQQCANGPNPLEHLQITQAANQGARFIV